MICQGFSLLKTDWFPVVIMPEYTQRRQDIHIHINTANSNKTPNSDVYIKI